MSRHPLQCFEGRRKKGFCRQVAATKIGKIRKVCRKMHLASKDKFSQKFVRMCVLRKQNASDIARRAMLIVMSVANYNTTKKLFLFS
jgi:hypothetical protein